MEAVVQKAGGLAMDFTRGLLTLLTLLLVEDSRRFRAWALCERVAALRLFAAAAQREAATVELARRIRRFLYRAQQDPELKLEITGTEE
jgi:hypothetical protein